MTAIPAVPDSPEFRRIYNLPRRVLAGHVADDTRSLAPLQIPDWRTALGVHDGVGPRYWQSVAASELHWNRGLFAAMPVGIGKTWLSYVAAHCVGATRPLLFVPAMAVEKTRIEFKELARHWVQPQPLPLIATYHDLTQKKNVRMLETIRPDLIIFDECDQLRNLETGSAPIRVDRFFTANPSVMCVAMTGTIGRKSYQDYAHIMRWCLKERSPLPLFEGPLWQWCQALDDDDLIGMARWRPGVLMHLAEAITAEEHALLEADPWLSDGGLGRARAGVLKRMIETPGVLIVDESTCDQPLTIDFIRAPVDRVIDEAFYLYGKTSERPDGVVLMDNLSKFNHVDALGEGFWERWDPPAPGEWIAARKAWFETVKTAKETTRHTPFPLDTEAAVAEAMPNDETLLEWRKCEAQTWPGIYGDKPFEPNPVATWYSASVVYTAAQWIEYWEARGEKVLVWARSRPMAQGIMSVTNTPYYGSKGMRHDQYFKPGKESIENCKRNADGSPISSAILSFDANYKVRNLQRYNRQLIIGWNGAANEVEQWLGRTHRSGQERPCYTTILLTSKQTLRCFRKTLQEARGVVQRNGHTQKILEATIAPYPADDQDASPRWLTRVADDE